ncbi:hypothetical protein XBFFL1_1090036 [Xenorhabdus bovienii str. feltiae Florida]|uniref:Uncharacterized protein n=1 Tax=Xenorhabdus bovienii TaxID=40576 RepID=A0A0B6XDR9_XENBV|nr:hypothetical protein XBFFR1_1130020 [Xenorhabdus bovienii str. feltiae France]CDG90758.1 hypothetical protein XBFFL1_1090036 [Xenorhabdus bovienii str. feltiae Florida]CDM92012.1 protein of unknown function [Xenorhabdus bovienii]
MLDTMFNGELNNSIKDNMVVNKKAIDNLSMINVLFMTEHKNIYNVNIKNIKYIGLNWVICVKYKLQPSNQK